MPAAIVVGGAVLSEGIKANGARKAANQQVKGIRSAKSDLNAGYDKAQTYQDPYVKAGEQTLSTLTEGLKSGGEFNRNFGESDFKADPGYAFRMSEGLKGVERSAAGRTGALSGGAIKATQQFGQNLAAQEYQSAYQRFNNDISNRFNRLDQIAGRGQHAADFSSQSEQQRGTSLGNLSMNQGNVLAAKEIAYANAGANVVNTGFNEYGYGTKKPAQTSYDV